jgi:phosphoesterase RecJ-like protein
VFPDGDNVGSVLAFSEILSQLGKKHAAYLEGPLPVIYKWMHGADQVHIDIDEAAREINHNVEEITLVLLDSGDLDRPGQAFCRWYKSRKHVDIVNIDHHVSNSEFGDINWVDPGYSSVGEMLFDVIGHMDLKLTRSIAQNLFVSIYTDTGRFSFSNTSARSLKYAGELIEAGASPITAFRNVYANRTMESFQLQVESFKTLSRFLDGKGCYFNVDQGMLERTGTTIDDTEGFIDMIRTLRDFHIVVFFKEVDANDIRVSTRAYPPIHASKLMSLFGGGGHPRAAGCRIEKPLEEAMNYFIRRAEQAINTGEALENGT